VTHLVSIVQIIWDANVQKSDMSRNWIY